MTRAQQTPVRNGWAEAAVAFGVCGLLAGVGLTLTGHDGTAGVIAGICLLVLTAPQRVARRAAGKPQD